MEGPARVVDGDGLEIGEARIRLFGIDAPERDQTCTKDDEPWACGEASPDALAELVGGSSTRCEREDVDRYGRTVATCFLPDGRDIGRAQVRTGWALAYRDFSTRYVDDEGAASQEHLGMWAGEFVPPWEWRNERRAPASSASEPPDPACVIKGNVSRSSGARIFHVPGQADYEATRIDPERGERWFCSDAEAEAAGWRKARR